MKKILIIFGTRPEAIKMCPLVNMLKKKLNFNVKVCVTGQHRDMLDSVLQLFEITPDYDLNIMQKNQSLGRITAKILLKIEKVLEDFLPDFVCVHGDTTTTFSASLAAYYKKTPVLHIEAGLRTGNIYSPWPEEINRKLTGSIAKYHFCPTIESQQNLLKEGILESKTRITGNTVIDALKWVIAKIDASPQLKKDINQSLQASGYKINERPFILITGHRRENFGDGFLNICNAIKDAATAHPEYDFVYPVHLNPNVQGPVNKYLSNIKNIYLLNPLDYLPFVILMKHCRFILTDSGGIQEEAPSLGKPVLVMRETTERPEALLAGTVRLVGTQKEKIVNNIIDLIENELHYQAMSEAYNPYGDGKACERIASFISNLP